MAEGRSFRMILSPLLVFFTPALHLDGLSGRLNPPTRFMYCLYSVFFSFRTPYTLFPFTFVFFVDLKPANPIIRLNATVSGSESSSGVSTAIVSTPFTVFEEDLDAGTPFVLEERSGFPWPRGSLGRGRADGWEGGVWDRERFSWCPRGGERVPVR